jgi:hypothetical protein
VCECLARRLDELAVGAELAAASAASAVARFRLFGRADAYAAAADTTRTYTCLTPGVCGRTVDGAGEQTGTKEGDRDG